jgi:phospholipid/cholesterol/gamma-HCH transport system substrate-binding protein
MTVGVMWGKGYRSQDSDFPIAVRFSNVGGLSPGDPVQVAGVQSGEVGAIELREQDVLVTLTLDDTLRFYEGYSFRVVTLNFTGEMGVAINPGSGARISLPPLAVGVPALDLATMVAPVAEAARKLGAAADSLSSSLPGVLARLDGAVKNADHALAGIDTLVMQNRHGVRRMIAEVRTAMRVLSGVGVRADTAFTAMGLVATDLKVALGSVAGAADSLRRAVGEVRGGRGTLGRLVADDSLYVDLKAASLHMDTVLVHLDSLILDVQRNPGRYVTVNASLF